MGRLSLYGKELRKLGFPETDNSISIAIQVMHKEYKHASKQEALKILAEVLKNPQGFLHDPILQKIAMCLAPNVVEKQIEISLAKNTKEYNVFGREYIDPVALRQMDIAMKLPIATAGALMPDAHQGFGLPIGGVLATQNTIIPYAVGVDIGCRMSLSIFNVSDEYLPKHSKSLIRALESETKFGSAGEFRKPMEHEVLDSDAFKETRLLRSLHGKATRQIGTSGSGNHFVEFGIVEIIHPENEFGLAKGKYLGLLSHSGSRGLGAAIAEYYTRIAIENCPLPAAAKNFAWLDLDSEAGIEYWNAMQLAGNYATACHEQIHRKLSKAIDLKPVVTIENHHNFAWKEQWEGATVVVHRKGATPAGKGVWGIIPGSMVDPGYIVKGTGNTASISSASHGAGRKMSRSQAKNAITKNMMDSLLKKHGITLLGGGLDESPMAYKDITNVMQAQKSLVEIMGKFLPRIVRMDE